MSSSRAEQIIQQYLDRVSTQLSDLAAEDRDEIIADLRAHIEESLGDSDGASEADVRNTLDRLGDPAELAQEARLRVGDARPQEPEPVNRRLDKSPSALEVASIILTAILWPIGVVLAWVSPRWLIRDKVIATAIPAAGSLVLLAFILGGLMVWDTGASESVSVDQETFNAERAEPGESGADERSPRTVSETSDESNPWVRLAVVFGFIIGAIASPFVAAVYLAIRLQPVEVRVDPDGRLVRDSSPAGGHA